MVSAAYRPIADLTRVEREAERLRAAERSKKGKGRPMVWPEGVGPQTRRGLERRYVSRGRRTQNP